MRIPDLTLVFRVQIPVRSAEGWGLWRWLWEPHVSRGCMEWLSVQRGGTSPPLCQTFTRCQTGAWWVGNGVQAAEPWSGDEELSVSYSKEDKEAGGQLPVGFQEGGNRKLPVSLALAVGPFSSSHPTVSSGLWCHISVWSQRSIMWATGITYIL